MLDPKEVAAGHAILDKIGAIYEMPQSEQQEHIEAGILAGDFTQDDVDYLFDRWDNYD